MGTPGEDGENGKKNVLVCDVPDEEHEIQIVSPVRFVRRVKEGIGRRIMASTLLDVPDGTNPGTSGRNELDTMADTSCAGHNWTVLYFTGDKVEVSPFSEEYKSMPGIPVATCGTLITTESGREYILIGNEMLWFGKKMKRTLVNPNQFRMNGVAI